MCICACVCVYVYKSVRLGYKPNAKWLNSYITKTENDNMSPYQLQPGVKLRQANRES